jgi:hypothetical protein
MKITIDQKYTTVNLYKVIREKLPEIRKNKSMFEDMLIYLQGIRELEGWELHSCRAEIREIEIFGTFFPTMRAEAILEGVCSNGAGERCKDYIARVSIYGELTDEYTYFKWQEANEDGTPAAASISAKMYLADI